MPVLACRGCLKTDSRLFNIYQFKLYETFEELLGYPIFESDDLPKHICSICYVLLIKYAAFRNRCRVAQDLLDNLQIRGIELTTDYIKNIDRKKYNLLMEFKKAKPDLDMIIQEQLPDDTLSDDDHGFNDTTETLSPENEINDKVTNSDRAKSNKQHTHDNKFEQGLSKPLTQSKAALNTTSPVHNNTKKQLPTPLPKYSEIRRVVVFPNNIPKGSDFQIASKQVQKALHLTKNLTVKSNSSVKSVNKKQNTNIYSNPKLFNEWKENRRMDVVFLTTEQQLQELKDKVNLTSQTWDGPFCPDCGKKCKSESTLQRHKNICHDEALGPEVCSICSYRFKEGHLDKHLKSHAVKITCQICNFTTKSFRAATTHSRNHGFLDKQTFTCTYCEKTFDKRVLLNDHIWTTHPKELPWCKCCGERFKTNTSLNSHTMRVHVDYMDSIHKCENCYTKFATKEALEKHFTLTCEKFNCVMCGLHFGAMSSLEYHVVQDHSRCKFIKLEICERCGVRFFGSEPLEKHQEAESCETGFPCELCGDAFDTQDLLGHHKSEFHTKLYRACDECNQAFDAHNYRQHLDRVHNTKPKVKGFCSGIRSHTSTKMWAVHGNIISAVGGEKRADNDPPPTSQWICDVCGKTFKKYMHLKVHRRVHTGERPYQCADCGKGYIRKDGLKAHVLLHSGERPRACGACPKRFRTRAALMRHHLCHTNIRRHICQLCGKTFRTSTSVKIHIKGVHLHAKTRGPRRKRGKLDEGNRTEQEFMETDGYEEEFDDIYNENGEMTEFVDQEIEYVKDEGSVSKIQDYNDIETHEMKTKYSKKHTPNTDNCNSIESVEDIQYDPYQDGERFSPEPVSRIVKTVHIDRRRLKKKYLNQVHGDISQDFTGNLSYSISDTSQRNSQGVSFNKNVVIRQDMGKGKYKYIVLDSEASEKMKIKETKARLIGWK